MGNQIQVQVQGKGEEILSWRYVIIAIVLLITIILLTIAVIFEDIRVMKDFRDEEDERS